MLRYIAFVLLLVAIGIDNRSPLTSLSAIAASIRSELGMTELALTLLGSVPVICFGIVGSYFLLRGYKGRLLPIIFVSQIMIAAGLATRAIPSEPMIFAGTIICSLGIGTASVFVPALIRQQSNRALGLHMGIYTTAMSLGGAFGALATVPLVSVLEFRWNTALAIWAVPACLALLLWPVMGRGGTTTPTAIPNRDTRVAWYVTAYMGMQAGLAFMVIAWMPILLQERGLTALAAGSLTALSLLSQSCTALGVPVLAARMKEQRMLVIAALMAVLAGFAGVAILPTAYTPVWVVVLGLGQGGAFGLANVFIGLRSNGSAEAVRLSGMAHSFGYLIASAGPFAIGLVRMQTTDPAAQLLIFGFFALAGMYAGLVAGTR